MGLDWIACVRAARRACTVQGGEIKGVGSDGWMDKQVPVHLADKCWLADPVSGFVADRYPGGLG